MQRPVRYPGGALSPLWGPGGGVGPAPPGAGIETAAAGDAWVPVDGGGRLWIAHPEEAVPLLTEAIELDELDRRSIAAPSTPDGLPLHGPVPGLDGLVLACGHGDHGVALAPGVGAAVAAGVESGAWDPALSPARFASPPTL